MSVFGIRAGVTVWHHDAANNALVGYFAASQHAWMNLDTRVDQSSDTLSPTASGTL